jgi:hypothetical protein
MCGYGYKVHETYTYNPNKKFIIPYSICKGVLGIPVGMFYAFVIPCIVVFETAREIDNHFTNKE